MCVCNTRTHTHTHASFTQSSGVFWSEGVFFPLGWIRTCDAGIKSLIGCLVMLAALKIGKKQKAAATTSSLIKMNTQFELPLKVLQPSVLTSVLALVERKKIIFPFSCSLQGLKQLLTGHHPKAVRTYILPGRYWQP